VNRASKPLSQSVLRCLTNDAIATFLGEATRYESPAGYRLYEKLGFETVCAANVWVSGETHQA